MIILPTKRVLPTRFSGQLTRDEFLDLFDILADVADLGDMADAGIELGQVVAELDIADVDADYLEGLAELDDTSLSDPEEGFEAASESDAIAVDPGLNAAPTETGAPAAPTETGAPVEKEDRQALETTGRDVEISEAGIHHRRDCAGMP